MKKNHKMPPQFHICLSLAVMATVFMGLAIPKVVGGTRAIEMEQNSAAQFSTGTDGEFLSMDPAISATPTIWPDEVMPEAVGENDQHVQVLPQPLVETAPPMDTPVSTLPEETQAPVETVHPMNTPIPILPGESQAPIETALPADTLAPALPEETQAPVETVHPTNTPIPILPEESQAPIETAFPAGTLAPALPEESQAPVETMHPANTPIPVLPEESQVPIETAFPADMLAPALPEESQAPIETSEPSDELEQPTETPAPVDTPMPFDETQDPGETLSPQESLTPNRTPLPETSPLQPAAGVTSVPSPTELPVVIEVMPQIPADDSLEPETLLFPEGVEMRGSDALIRISSEQARQILENFEQITSDERKAVLLTAHSLIGRVDYFWGGKSAAIGWDRRWGNAVLTDVDNGDGGSMRTYGLDCSGFVTWVFNNAAQRSVKALIGNGSSNQWGKSEEISWTDAQVGDLAFKCRPGEETFNHVGIVTGWTSAGDLLITHCSAKNGITETTAYEGGFRHVRRPDIFANQAFCFDAAAYLCGL